jgi:hypothetical protein
LISDDVALGFPSGAAGKPDNIRRKRNLQPLNLTTCAGLNVNNPLATSNVFDDKQVYVQTAVADNYTSTELKVFVRFTRKLEQRTEEARIRVVPARRRSACE